jgi:4-diphosphocytidyl-2-C-methyl-D-erythritol kinase
MQALYDVPAPAKLNLFLHITGRRADGYHLLQSVFTLIDWADTLHFELRSDGKISREDLTWALPPQDLTLQAAQALQQATGCALGAHIGVAKSVPAQAGMGGGSSDAASTLLALNRLWGLQLPLEKLAEIGLKLGADVPFFLQGRNAWVEGIGERISPVAVPSVQYCVVKPEAGLDTRMIFSDPDLKRDTQTAIITGFPVGALGQEVEVQGEFHRVFNFGQNDLQVVAQKLCPGVTQALDWLAAQGLNGRMTGSGSAVFAYIPAKMLNSIALVCAQPVAMMQIRLCNGLDVHPLIGWANSRGVNV